jgi:hypothetical protein
MLKRRWIIRQILTRRRGGKIRNLQKFWMTEIKKFTFKGNIILEAEI